MKGSISRVLAVCGRELHGYFFSPLAYVFIVIFLLLAGFFTFSPPPFGNFLATNRASLSESFFNYLPWIYLALVPPIAMRLWSEELRSGTIELLLTTQVSVKEAVLGKYIGAWLVLGACLLLTFPLVVTVNYLGSPDNLVIASGYFGAFLLAGAYLAIGCLTSSLTRSPVVSFIISVAACLALLLAGHPAITDLFTGWAPVWLTDILGDLSFFPHFYAMQVGVVDARDLLYFASVILFGLFATGVALNSRRKAWN